MILYYECHHEWWKLSAFCEFPPRAKSLSWRSRKAQPVWTQLEYPTQFAVFVTDTRGSVIWRNRRLYGYERSGSIKLESNKVHFSDTYTHDKIKDTISDACEYRIDGDVIFAGKCNRDRPIHFLVRPSAPENESTGAIVALHDPMQQIRPKPHRLAQLYNLTQKESLVAEAIATGLAPNRACESLSISLPTYRTHVQRILKKCGASNQIHLSLIISSGIACVWNLWIIAHPNSLRSYKKWSCLVNTKSPLSRQRHVRNRKWG